MLILSGCLGLPSSFLIRRHIRETIDRPVKDRKKKNIGNNVKQRVTNFFDSPHSPDHVWGTLAYMHRGLFAHTNFKPTDQALN